MTLPTSNSENDTGHLGFHDSLHAFYNDFDHVTTPADGDVWEWDNTLGEWKPTAPSGGGGGGLTVSWITTSQSISSSGIYLVDSSAAIVTLTLPTLSSLGANGYMRVVVKRHGANEVRIDTTTPDNFEPGSVTRKTLAVDFSAISLVAHNSGTYWYEMGYYGSVT